MLLPVKGGAVEEEAIDLACELVKGSKGKVYATYVIEVPRDLPLDAEVAEETARGEIILKEVEKAVRKRHCQVEAQLLQARDAGPALVQEAAEKAVGVIVLALPYMRRLGNFTLGDTVPYILKNAPCQVLLWRNSMVFDSSNGASSGTR